MARSEGLLLSALCTLPERRLRLGRTEKLVVQALLEQREHALQSGGRMALCLRLDELEACTGVAPPNIKRAVSRVNTKLIVQGLTITWLHTNLLGQLGYALFRVSEVFSLPENCPQRDTTAHVRLLDWQ